MGVSRPPRTSSPPGRIFSARDLISTRDRIRQSREFFFMGVFLRRKLGSDPEAAALVSRALRMLFTALVSLFDEDSSRAETDLGELLRRVMELNQKHGLYHYPVDQHFELIQQLAALAESASPTVDSQMQQEFRLLLRRIPGVFRDVESYIRGQRRLTMSWPRRMVWPLTLVSIILVITVALVGRSFYRQHRCVVGEYFHGANFKKRAFERRDCVIDFNWGNGSPGGKLAADNFSVRWQGILEIDSPGYYTFGLESDDGSRLYVDKKLVIDHWSEHAFSAREGRVYLKPGSVPFRLEMYEHTMEAAVRFYWREKGKKLVVPPGMVRSP